MHSLAMKAGKAALVLKEFEMNKAGPRYVHILARRSGLMAWILTSCGIDVTTTLDIYEDHILFTEGSLSGQLKTCMPLSSLSVVTCGFTKPFVMALCAVILFVLGIMFVTNTTAQFGIILIALGVVYIIGYFLRKAMIVSLMANSGWDATICFKRSVIENVPVDYNTTMEVVNLVNGLISRQQAQ